MRGCSIAPSGPPKFGLTSKCGKLLQKMSRRSRWPEVNRLLVGLSSIAITRVPPGTPRSRSIMTLQEIGVAIRYPPGGETLIRELEILTSPARARACLSQEISLHPATLTLAAGKGA